MTRQHEFAATLRAPYTQPTPPELSTHSLAFLQISLESLITFLVDIPFFAELDASERGEVARIMELRHLEAGETAFREGDPGDAWYVLLDGHASVIKNAANGPGQIAQLAAGTCFGEMAILDGMPRSATVIASGPATVLCIRRNRFDELLQQGSLGAYKLVAAMARTLSLRQRQLTQQFSDLRAEREAPFSVRQVIDNRVDQFRVSE